MKQHQYEQMIAKASRSVRRLNQAIAAEIPRPEEVVVKPKKRIRQRSKPLLNKLENEFLLKLTPPFDSPGWRIVPQSLRFRLANGLWYKPDFLKVGDDADSPIVAYEVKGPHAFRGGFENLKMAASQYPWIKWVVVWKDEGVWQEQVVLP